MNVSEAFELYIYQGIRLKGGAVKTEKNYRSALSSFIKGVGDIPIEFIAIDTVNNWQGFMMSMANSPNTVKHNLCHLRQVLNHLSKLGVKVMDYRDIELPNVHRSNPSYVVPDEVTDLIEAVDSLRDKALIACLYSTGCRISELLNLNRDDIRGKEILVLGKNSKYRTVFISGDAHKLLQSYLNSRKDKIPALFISGQYRRITVSRVAQIIHLATAEAGIEKNITPHTFRHGYATDLVRNGANLLAVKDLLGHESIQTTQIYTHTNKPYLEETYKKYHTNA